MHSTHTMARLISILMSEAKKHSRSTYEIVFGISASAPFEIKSGITSILTLGPKQLANKACVGRSSRRRGTKWRYSINVTHQNIARQTVVNTIDYFDPQLVHLATQVLTS